MAAMGPASDTGGADAGWGGGSWMGRADVAGAAGEDEAAGGSSTGTGGPAAAAEALTPPSTARTTSASCIGTARSAALCLISSPTSSARLRAHANSSSKPSAWSVTWELGEEAEVSWKASSPCGGQRE